MTAIRRLPSAIASAALLLGVPLCAAAQSLTTGSLGGVLRDAQGLPVAGVSLTLQRDGDSELHRDTSDAEGEFRADELVPGTYTVSAQRDGFAEIRVSGVQVLAASTQRLVLLLSPAAVAQSVSVRAVSVERPSLADSPLNADLTPAELQTLPIDDRRYQSFALLTPLANLAGDAAGPVPDPSVAAPLLPADDDTVSSGVPTITTRALSPSQSSFTQDGAVATRSYDGAPRGGNDIPFDVPLEAIREFQVRTIGSSPLGRDAAGLINAVTRRGEDALHGTAFFQIRNDVADAADPFAIATHYNAGAPYSAPVKPRDQREQFGGSLGRFLPGTHNRVYAFGAAEAQLRSFPGISTPDNPSFYTLTAIQRALLGNRGVGAAAISSGFSFLDSLGGEVPRHSHTFAVTPRLDVHTSANTHLLVTYTGARHDAPSAQRDGPVINRSRDNFATVNIAADTLQLRQEAGLGPRWVVAAGAIASRDNRVIDAAPVLNNEPHTGPGGTVPQVNIDLGNAATGGSFRFGTPVSALRRTLPEEQRLELQATANFSGRAHTLAFEVDGSFIDTMADTAAATAGSYQYSSRSTSGRAGGLVDFLTDYTYSATSYPNGGCPSIYAAVHLFCFQSFTQAFGAAESIRFHTGEASAAIHDEWRLTPRLNVALGARYEYFRMPLPQHVNTALDTVFGNLGLTGFLPGDPGNLAPRLGIAYGVSDRTVVRVGYGMHFGRVTGRALQQVLMNTAEPTSTYNVRVVPQTSIDPACSSAGTNFGYPATYTCGYGGGPPQTSAATILSRRFQLPMVQDAELTVERELPGGITMSGSYTAALSRELPNSVDANIAPSLSTATFAIQRDNTVTTPGLQNGATFTIPLYTQRISPNYGPVTLVLSNGNGVYQAGVFQISRNAGRGLTLRCAYTFSKSLDNLRVTGASVDTDAAFDPFQPLYDRALSNLDRRHKVVALAVWSPTVERGSRLVRGIANGFSLAPIVFVTSGRPYSYLVEGGTYLTGGRDSLNGSGGATYLPNVGRNTLRLPPVASADLRLTRLFPLTDRARLRLSIEAFNLTNHGNVTTVSQRAFLVGPTANGITSLVFQDATAIAAEGLTTRPFATPISSGTDISQARRLQAGLRFEW